MNGVPMLENGRTERTFSDPQRLANVSDVESKQLQLELEKVQLERAKLDLETRKLDLERVKARWMAFSVVIPLIAAISTVAYGIWANYQQAKAQFEVKVAEVIMQSGSPREALGRAMTFMAMFPDRLPKDFAVAFGSEKYTQETEAPEAKKEFLKLLADKGLGKEEIVQLWKYLFPDDAWIKGFSLDTITRKPASGEPVAPAGSPPPPSTDASPK